MDGRAGQATVHGVAESDTTEPLTHSFNATCIPALSPAPDNSSAARSLTPPTSITTCSHKTAPESHYLRWDSLCRCQLLLAEAMPAIWNLLAPIPAGLLPQLYEESRYGAFKHCKNLTGLPWWLSGKESACQCRRLRFYHCVRKIPWRRTWQPTPVFLPGESHGKRSLAGYSA